jgi:hypothetical protein
VSDEDLVPRIAIVISYLRKDTPGGVARLRESLVPQFGRENVFLDIDTLRPGVNWRKTIPETIAGADVFLPVIGHHWLDATDDRGRRRLDLPNDVLRFEVATALKAGIPIIPVQLHGAPMPDAEELPDDIAELTDFMSIRIEDDDWESDVGKLLRVLETVRSEKAEAERRRAEEERRLAEEQRAEAARAEAAREAEQRHAAEERQLRPEAEAGRAVEERQPLLEVEERRKQEEAGARRLADEQRAAEKAARRSEQSWLVRAARLTRRPSRRTLAIVGSILLVAVVIPLTGVLILESRENAKIARYEDKILAKVPGDAEECIRSSEGEDGAVVQVACTVKGDSLWYLAFDSPSKMNDWYVFQISCMDEFGFAHGRACIERSFDSRWLAWTDTRHDIAGRVIGSSKSAVQLRKNLACCFALTP